MFECDSFGPAVFALRASPRQAALAMTTESICFAFVLGSAYTLRPVKVILVHNAKFPVRTYGGTERVVWWLAKGLSELGIRVLLAGEAGSTCPFAEVITPDFRRSLEDQLPDADLCHYFVTPAVTPIRPYVVTIGGNGQLGEKFLLNTVFVSRDHALRHGSESFVYNGVDPDECLFSDEKSEYLVFLAKASWRVKNVKGAIRIARKAGRSLRVLGGDRWLLKHWGGIHWEGMVGGRPKAEILSRSAGLLFPVLWQEPFGLAVIESLISGTPVIGSSFGSLKELIAPHVGAICHTEQEFVDAVNNLGAFSPKQCREWALERFHFKATAENYVSVYEKILRGESLNQHPPQIKRPCTEGCVIPRC